MVSPYDYLWGQTRGRVRGTRKAAMIVQVGGDRWTSIWELGRFWKDLEVQPTKSTDGVDMGAYEREGPRMAKASGLSNLKNEASFDRDGK